MDMKDVIRNQTTPTQKTYSGLNAAYDFFNTRLFHGVLPDCLITMQRKKNSYGYFAHERFGATEGNDKADEIALNPSHFKNRSTEEVLSTLVHEMVHLWQYRFGKPSRPGYHNKEWGEKMETVGLIPSTTGAEGGKKTGQKMSHYIVDGGTFSNACAELLKDGFQIPYVELWTEEGKAKAKKKAASKTKYTCPDCGLNAWAKPETRIACVACDAELEAEG